jgi:hypothetical protein
VFHAGRWRVNGEIKMMVVLHPTYTLTITVKDRSSLSAQLSGVGKIATCQSAPVNPYKYFGGYNSNRSGCDEILVAVRDALAKAGIAAEISLERFEHQA